MSADQFCDKLVGFYDNWFQAARDPARYAHVKLRWEWLDRANLAISSKQWYHYMGEDNAYRYRWHRVVADGNNIRVQNWSPDWKDHKPCCDMIFTLSGGLYKGQVATNDCIINGGTVVSVVEFNGETYSSRDQGWRDGKKVWGSDVIYQFQKTDKPLGV